MKRGWADKKNLSTAGRQTLQGATFGWGDEVSDRIAALYAAVLTDGKYSDYLKEARTSTNKDIAEDWKEAPLISLGANIAGSIPFALSAPAKALSGWSRANSMLGSVGKGAAVGAGYGAVAGAGSSNPDPNAELIDALRTRAAGSGIGALVGSALGAAGGALSRYLTPDDATNFSKVGKAVSKDKPTKAQKMLAEQLGARPDLKDQLARAESMNAASANTGIQLTLAEKIAQSPSDPLLAQQKILGGNPQTAGAMEALYAGRSGTQNQAGSIENALLGQAKKLAPDVGSYDEAATALIGKSKDAAKTATKQLTDKASPLYKEAFQANKSMQSPVFDKILETPGGKKALQHASELMQNQMVRMAVPDRELTEAARDLAMVGKVGRLPKEGVASGMKMETLDNIKKGFDAAIEDALSRSTPGTTSAEAKSLMSLKSALVSEMDNLDITKNIPAGRDPSTGKFIPATQHPEGGAYSRARGIYSGQPEVLQMRERIGNVANIDPLDAKNVGRNLFSGTQQNAEMAAKSLSAPPLKGYGPQDPRMPVAAKIYDVMDTARGDPTSFAGKIAPDSRTMDMIKAYGGGEIQETLDVINQAKIGEKFRYGSPTQPLQDASQGMQRAAGGALDLAVGNKVGLARKVIGMFGGGEDPKFYQDMMDLMTTDQGMDLVRQVANQQGTAVQKQQASKALVSALQNKTAFLPGSTRNAALIGLTSPQAPSPVFQQDSPQAQGLPPGFIRDKQNTLPDGFVRDRR